MINSHVISDLIKIRFFMACRMGSIYINLILIEHKDLILQSFSFDFTCINPILHDNNHIILDQNKIPFYMACRIGSIYINLILIKLEDAVLQALAFDSICISLSLGNSAKFVALLTVI
jgi:hypothetical protein